MTHAQEELNKRSLYLRMLRRLWIVPICGIVLAAIFGLLYTAYITGVASKRDYVVASKYYIHFAFNENTQKAYDYYNAYTWEDMIFSSPEISDHIVAKLPEGMDLATARTHVTADEASDIRLLTVEVRMSDPALAQQLSDGIHEGLVHFGETAEEFEEIEYLSQEGPKLEIINDRTNNAVLLGAFLGLLVSFCVLLLQETMDDRIYTPEEAVARYGLPVLGIWQRAGQAELPAFLIAERKINLEGLLDGKETLLVCSEGIEPTREAVESLKELQIPAIAAGTVTDDGFETSLHKAREEADHVVLVLPYGKGSGPKTENLLAQLGQMQVAVDGILLTQADSRFLRWYYRARS